MATLTRRQFIRAGAGLSLMPLLSWPSRAQETSFTPWILLVYVSGGWDTTMVFDDKSAAGNLAQEPGAMSAVSAASTTLPFVDHPDRPAVRTFFDERGANAAIVNGLNCGGMARDRAAAHILGAVPDKKTRRTDWLSFYAAYLNPAAAMPHIVVDAPFLPGENASVAVRLPTARIAEHLVEPPHAKTLGDAGEAALLDFRVATYRSVFEKQNGVTLDSEKLRSLYYGFARDDITGQWVRDAVDRLGAKPASESRFLRNAKLALELFASGASQCATVQAGADNAWDTMTDHYARQSALYQSLFSDINALLAHAEQLDVASKLTLVVVSERGREPILNASNGKGPWAFTSCLLWGAGIGPGVVAGKTDAALRGLPVNPIFGDQATGAVTLEMANVMTALYLKFNAPGTLFLPSTQPLSSILAAA